MPRPKTTKVDPLAPILAELEQVVRNAPPIVVMSPPVGIMAIDGTVYPTEPEVDETPARAGCAAVSYESGTMCERDPGHDGDHHGYRSDGGRGVSWRQDVTLAPLAIALGMEPGEYTVAELADRARCICLVLPSDYEGSVAHFSYTRRIRELEAKPVRTGLESYRAITTGQIRYALPWSGNARRLRLDLVTKTTLAEVMATPSGHGCRALGMDGPEGTAAECQSWCDRVLKARNVHDG